MALHATGLLLALLSSMAASVVDLSHAAIYSSTDPDLPAVLDTDGQKLIPGQKYYVVPVFRGLGGGLTIRDRGDKCPLYVSQADIDVQRGLPMTFTPENPDDEFVRVSTDLNVQVADVSSVWRLGGSDEPTGNRFVSIDGDKENPGVFQSIWFKIERRTAEEGGDEERFEYKFAFCPAACKPCGPLCGDLGALLEGDNWWLGMGNGRPFYVHFRAADDWIRSTVQGTM